MEHILCSSCSQLNIRSICLAKDVVVPAEGKPVVSLGKWTRRTTCEMCRFFLNLSPSYNRDYKLHVRLFDHIRQFRPQSTFTAPHTRFLSVLRDNRKIRYDYSVQDEITHGGFIVYLHTGPLISNPVPVRSVNPATVDFGLLNSLISRCQQSHALCNQVGSRAVLPYIYLMDCIDERIVREHPMQNYLALSYVWGEHNSRAKPQKELANSPLLFSEAPLTIRDAIRVVRNLGRRYLWVDRYCINQTENPEKKLMIQNMDQIYRNAEATIVALHGNNDQSGLPGVSEVFRTPQPRFQSAQGCLVSTCPPITTIIQRSKWATRGWTYQEARLSRRCLFFTEYQVYVSCLETTASEAVPSESQECWISWLLNSSCLDAAIFTPKAPMTTGLCLDRFVFSQRELTYDFDILDAFRGILTKSEFITFWGVPIVPPKAAMDPHTGFSLGLLWGRRPEWSKPRHLQPTKERPRIRRANFPTWSWTSVTGEVFQDGYGGQSFYGKYLDADDNVTIETDAFIQFSIYTEDKLVSLNEAVQQPLNVLPEVSPLLVVEGDIVRLTLIGGKHPYRVWECEHLALQFWVTYDLDQDMVTSSSEGRDLETYEEALILVDCNDDQKGTKKRFVMMLLNWVETNRAERRGLLSEYRTEYDAAELKGIPRTRKTFILQ